jgi:hypothetical protein
MVLGAVAFLCYAAITSWVLVRFKPHVLTATTALLPIWLGTSLGLWFLLFGR